MQTSSRQIHPKKRWLDDVVRRIREFTLISRDPVLFMSLLFSGIFIFVFVILPIFSTLSTGFFNKSGDWDLTYFARYFDNYLAT